MAHNSAWDFENSEVIAEFGGKTLKRVPRTDGEPDGYFLHKTAFRSKGFMISAEDVKQLMAHVVGHQVA